MVQPAIKAEIEHKLDQLPVELQQRVLNFAEALVMTQPHRRHNARFMQFAGILTDEEAQSILKAVEEGCE